ncbi:MAG TPA: peptide ABC transporter substrate-binding protein [Actinomycetota bacterium]|jgi:peptide/nickel transport system substrate-binding protein
MKATRRAAVLAAVIWLTGGALMTQPVSAQTSDDEPVIYDLGVDSDLSHSLNPWRLCCGPDYEYGELVYDTGLAYSQEDLTAAPKIITEWTPSDDYMSYTMKVRTDATWSDGEPLTVEDVAWTMNFISKYKMPLYIGYFPFNPTFEVVDDETLIWHSEEPTFAPEVPAYFFVLPEHIWGQFDTAGDPPAEGAPQSEVDAYNEALKEGRSAAREFANEDPVGSGPFILDEYRKGEYLHFVANPNYWGGHPSTEDPRAIDEVYIRFFGNLEAMTQALEAGQIDFADGLTPGLFNSLKSNEDVVTHVADAGCWGDIAFNFGGQPGGKATNHPALQDLAVRQAIAHSIDKQEIVDKVFERTAVVGDSFLTPGKNGSWYLDIPPDLEYGYDPAEANRILDDAGYLDTDGDGVREMPDGTDPLDFEFIAINDVDGSVGTGQLMDGYLRDIGIKMTTTTVDSDKATEIWGSGEFDALIWDWCPDPDPDFILSVFATEECGGWSNGCYSNPEYDALYHAQKQEMDRDEREQIIDEAQELVAQDLPEIVLNYWSELQAYRSDTFEGYHPTPNVENGLLMLGYSTTVNYLELRAVSEQAAPGAGDDSSGGLNWWVPALVGVGGIAVAWVLISRRSRNEDDEE